MNRTECPACSSLSKVHKYTINGFNIYECNECMSLYVQNVPTESEIFAIYKKSDYYTLPNDSEQRINIENARRAKIILEIVKVGKILDIGSAKGSFLDEMKKIKFKTFGLEMSSQNVDICKTKGHEVYLGDLDSYYNSVSKEQFDVIACLDVIEHVPRPDDFLKKIKTLLAVNGLLVLSTPNFSGLVSKILRNRDPFIIPPEHLNFFSKKGLEYLVTLNNFKTIRSTTFGFITEEGLDRTITKYFPAGFKKLSFMLKPLLKYSMKSLNLFKNGLELEYYLKNDK